MHKFIITFKREIPKNKKDEILNILITNLSGSLYKNLERVDKNKIIIKGEFYSFNPRNNVPWNLWTGFSKQTEVSIINNEISYSLDYTYAVISCILSIPSILILTVLSLYFFDIELSVSSFIYCFLILLTNSLLSIGYDILRHRKLFLNTLKNGSRFKGTYDWDRILKTKSRTELENIANGETTLTEEIQELAKKELDKRT